VPKKNYPMCVAINEKVKEFFRLALFITITALVIAYFAGAFDPKEIMYKPCEGMSGDMYKECVNFYIYEKGWTWDQVNNGIKVTRP